LLKRYVLDTNIFNRVVEGKLAITDLPSDGVFCASEVQINEIGKTKDHVKRTQLEETFQKIGPQISERKTTLWGNGGWGTGTWNMEGKYFDTILKELRNLHPKKSSDVEDALIGEISITENCVLISTDKDLIAVVKQLGGQTCLLNL
jgi:hypothetical protein